MERVLLLMASLVDQHETPGEQGQLFLPIVSQKNQREQGVKGSFKIAPACHQECSEYRTWCLGRYGSHDTV